MSFKGVLAAATAANVCNRFTASFTVPFGLCVSMGHFHSCLRTANPGTLCRLRQHHYGYHLSTGPRLGCSCTTGLTLCRRGRCQAWNSSGIKSIRCFPYSQLHRKYDASSWKNKDAVSDLQRFLSEIGTNPKEGRFWLKQFLNVNQRKPFAVVEIDPEVFADSSQLDHLASAVSFLQRNCLRPILVFGDVHSTHSHHGNSEKELRAASIEQSCALSDRLSEQGLESCVLFAGSNVLGIEQDSSGTRVTQVNQDLIQWCMMRQVIPIIPSFGETASGQIIGVTMWEVTSAVAKQLNPLKVIKVNCHGGFQNKTGRMIANINLPFDFHAAKDKTWCTEPVLQTIGEVSSLLSCLPEHTSVVITAADKVLQELFTHHGSGTFLKMTEPILKYHNLDKVDLERLKTLLCKSFNKCLSETYFDDIRKQVHTIFISERYTAGAVILRANGSDVPYLCKFAVSAQAQGEGTGEMLWDVIRRDFKRLFWRSRTNNHVNPWYFRKSDGSWNVNESWTVFWYGIPEPMNSFELIQKAVSTPESFMVPNNSAAEQNTTVASS